MRLRIILMFLFAGLPSVSFSQDVKPVDRDTYIAEMNKRTGEYRCRVEAAGENNSFLKFTCPNSLWWKARDALAYDDAVRQKARALGFLKLAFNNQERDVLYIDLYDPIQALPSEQSATSTTRQVSQSGIAQLIEVRQVIGSVFSMKALARRHAYNSPVKLDSVRVEPVYVGRSFSVREGTASIEFINQSSQAITMTEWKIDVYDQQRRALADTFYLKSSKSVRPGKKGHIHEDMGNLRLPYSPAVLVQITKIVFADSQTWKPIEKCAANDDLSGITCQ